MKVLLNRLEITTMAGCSVNCRFCPQDVFIREYTKGKRERALSYENFCRCIDKVPTETEIVFGGFSEVFQNEECIKMIQYANEKGHRLLLYTTLTGKGIDKKKFLDSVIEIPFEKCVVHIADDEGYANIPITEGYLELLECVLKSKRKNGKPFVDHLSCQGNPNKAIEEIVGGGILC